MKLLYGKNESLCRKAVAKKVAAYKLYCNDERATDQSRA